MTTSQERTPDEACINSQHKKVTLLPRTGLEAAQFDANYSRNVQGQTFFNSSLFREEQNTTASMLHQATPLQTQQNLSHYNDLYPSHMDGYWYNQAAPPYRPPFEQRKNIKLPKFTGNNFHAFKSAFIRCAK